MTTDAKAGAGAGAEGTAVGGSIALSISDNDNLASVGTGTALDVEGNLVIHAGNSDTQVTKSDADTEGAQTGVGVAFGLGSSKTMPRRAIATYRRRGNRRRCFGLRAHCRRQDRGIRQCHRLRGRGSGGSREEITNQTNHASDASGTTIQTPTSTRVDEANKVPSDQQSGETDENPAEGGNTGGSTTETEGGTVRVVAAIGVIVPRPT
jgi:hypothetical protein